MTRSPINFPLGGLSDDDAFSSQKPGTTRDAVNVRGVDPVTGRARGAQREGMSKYIESEVGATGERVRDLSVVTRSAALINYTNLHLTEGDGHEAATPLVEEWAKTLELAAAPIAIDTDFSDNVYALFDSSVQVFNSEGTLVREAFIPLPSDFSVVHKIHSDASRNIYVAASNASGSVGRVWKMAPSDSDADGYEGVWSFDVAGAIESFAADEATMLLVSFNRQQTPSRRMHQALQIQTALPEVVDLGETPGPVQHMTFDDSGACLISMLPNAARGAHADNGYITHRVDSELLWNPHELHQARERIYFWVDAENIDGEDNASLSTGDRVTQWNDNRTRWTTDGDGTYPPIFDTASRILFAQTSKREAPFFDADALGGMPGVRFDASAPPVEEIAGSPGTSLVSFRNKDNATKTTSTSRWDGSRAVMPNGKAFATFLVVRPSDNTSRHLLSQNNHTAAHDVSKGALSPDYALLTNTAFSFEETLAGAPKCGFFGYAASSAGQLEMPRAYVSGDDDLDTPNTSFQFSLGFWLKVGTDEAQVDTYFDNPDAATARIFSWGGDRGLEITAGRRDNPVDPAPGAYGPWETGRTFGPLIEEGSLFLRFYFRSPYDGGRNWLMYRPIPKGKWVYVLYCSKNPGDRTDILIYNEDGTAYAGCNNDDESTNYPGPAYGFVFGGSGPSGVPGPGADPLSCYVDRFSFFPNDWIAHSDYPYNSGVVSLLRNAGTVLPDQFAFANYEFDLAVNDGYAPAQFGSIVATGTANVGIATGIAVAPSQFQSILTSEPRTCALLNPSSTGPSKNGQIRTSHAQLASVASNAATAYIDGESNSDVLLITIVNNGDLSAAGGSCTYRVNGKFVDDFDFPGAWATGNQRTQLGHPDYRSTAAVGAQNLFGGSEANLAANWTSLSPEAFNGHVFEILTVLAASAGTDDSTDCHNVPFCIPRKNLVTDGTVAPWLAAREPYTATEIELLEGYLAHKWGISHELPNTVQDYYSGIGQRSGLGHPFGGTGNFPLRESARGENLQRSLHQRDVWSPNGVLYKFSPMTGDIAWSRAGSGFGSSAASVPSSSFSSRSSVVSVGPNYNKWEDVEDPADIIAELQRLGPDNRPDRDTVLRAFEDWLSSVEAPTASRGFLFLDPRVVPLSARVAYGDIEPVLYLHDLYGETITLNDGANAAVTLTFAETLTFDTDIVIGVDPGPGIVASAFTVLRAVKVAVDRTAASHNLLARHSGEFSLELFIKDEPAAFNASNVAIDLSSAASAWFGSYGFVDGRPDGTGFNLSSTASSGEVDQDALVVLDDNRDIWVSGLNYYGSDFGGILKIGSAGEWVNGSPSTPLSVWRAEADPAEPDLHVSGLLLPLSHPLYLNQDPEVTGPLHLLVAGGDSSQRDSTAFLKKLSIVSKEFDFAGVRSSRATRLLAVSGGSLYEILGGAPVLKGAGGEFDATSQYLSSTTLLNKVFWTDARKYWVYDSELDTLEEMKSRDAGPMPKHGRLIESWRGRLVIARTEDDPHNVYMSRVGDPFNWDEFPLNPDTLEAVSFGVSRVGLSPDIVNALIPYNDDLMIIGGDHTIQRLTGDPNAAGQLDLVSDVTGIAFGDAWCKDPAGRIFFFGSKGGVYVMVPGGVPEKITRDRIERRMSELDLSANLVRMVWNYRAEGLHVFVVPMAQPTLGEAPEIRAWFMDKNGAWWEDQFARTNEAPASVALADGDLPDDRVLLLGGGDGFLRYWDELAVSDDGQRIDSHVLLGPLTPADTTQQVKFMRPQVTLGAQQSGCDFEWFSSDTAELPGSPVASGKVGPGMNPTLPVRTRGTAVWLRLRNAAIAERWAFERASVDVAGGGRERVR